MTLGSTGRGRTRILAVGQTDLGRRRESNEDAFAVLPDDGMFIVADGMGGHHAGTLAANVVVTALPRALLDRLTKVSYRARTAVLEAIRCTMLSLSQELYTQAASDPNLTGMGATVVVIYARGDRAYIANMGDSRVYRFRNGRLLRLTDDHSVIGILLKHGEIGEEEAKEHPARGVVSRFIGMQQPVDPDLRAVRMKAGDRMLLCTDGLTTMLTDRQISEILSRIHDGASACRELVETANAAGGKDNVTVVIADWGATVDNSIHAPDA